MLLKVANIHHNFNKLVSKVDRKILKLRNIQQLSRQISELKKVVNLNLYVLNVNCH